MEHQSIMKGSATVLKDEVWDQYRQIITTLYRDQKMPLKQVQEVMERDYDFKATKRQYMRRIKRWDIFKNLKAAEKEMLANQVMSVLASNTTIEDIKFRDRPVSVTKIMRHLADTRRKYRRTSHNTDVKQRTRNPRGKKTSRRQSQACLGQSEPGSGSGSSSGYNTDSTDSDRISTPPSSEPTPSTTTPASKHAQGLEMTVKTLSQQHAALTYRPSTPRDSFNFELLLHRITLLTTLARHNPGLEEPPASISCWKAFRSGVYLLKSPTPYLAWPVLQSACNDATRLVSKPLDISTTALPFLRGILATLSLPNTKYYPTVRISLLRFLGELFSTKVTTPEGGQHRLLAEICSELLKDSSEKEVSKRALNCILDANTRQPKSDYDPVQTFKTQSALVSLHRRDNDLDSAEKQATQLIENSKFCFGTSANETCTAMMELVYVYTYQQRYTEGLELCLEMLSLKKTRLGMAYPDSQACSAMENMAELSHYSGDIGNCIRWLTTALDGSWNLKGGCVDTVHIRDKLKQMLVTKGRLEEAALLETLYPAVT